MCGAYSLNGTLVVHRQRAVEYANNAEDLRSAAAASVVFEGGKHGSQPTPEENSMDPVVSLESRLQLERPASRPVAPQV